MTSLPAKDQDLALEDFPFQAYDKLRYVDCDSQGHVNNAAFSTFLETGRVEFLYDPESPLTAEQGSFVIVSLSLTFRAEVTWPGRIDIGTGVTKVGNSSVSLHQRLFQAGRCVATADSVIVHVDERTRKSRPLTDGAKAFLWRHQLA